MEPLIRIWGDVFTAVGLRGLAERKLGESKPQSKGRMRATQNTSSKGDGLDLTSGRWTHSENIWRNKAGKPRNLMKDMHISTQEVQSTPSRMNSKTPTPRHIIIELSEDRTLRAAREVAHRLQGILSQFISRFLIRNFGPRRQWPEVFKVPKRRRKNNGKAVLQKRGRN